MENHQYVRITAWITPAQKKWLLNHSAISASQIIRVLVEKEMLPGKTLTPKQLVDAQIKINLQSAAQQNYFDAQSTRFTTKENKPRTKRAPKQ